MTDITPQAFANWWILSKTWLTCWCVRPRVPARVTPVPSQPRTT